MITLILFFLAGMFNAVMDRTGDRVAFNGSIFHLKNTRFWSKEDSWQYATKVFGWKADAWHIAKSCMVTCLVCAAVFYKPILHICKDSSTNAIFDVLLLGTTWNASFNLFYNKILKK
ncbi:hypothetical protein [Pinibacter soli]|uniref:SdpI family protein n=1 Tax=Pinibacter soli TaxID=3044211 RepID=A0ABT6RC28_9BACT|nr:hypothetical protein [Pinibacter soli]MDI3320011.1 hypothetical protein [Pinibacter soli]